MLPRALGLTASTLAQRHSSLEKATPMSADSRPEGVMEERHLGKPFARGRALHGRPA